MLFQQALTAFSFCNFVVQNSEWAVAVVFSVTILEGVGCSVNNFFFQLPFYDNSTIFAKIAMCRILKYHP